MLDGSFGPLVRVKVCYTLIGVDLKTFSNRIEDLTNFKAH